MFTTYTNPTRYDVRRDLVPPTPIVQSPYWFYEQPDDGPLTRPKHVVLFYISVAYYIVIPSDKLCFWLHVYVNIHIIYSCTLYRSWVVRQRDVLSVLIHVFWYCVSCRPVDRYRCLERARCLHLQSQAGIRGLWIFPIYQSTLCNLPEALVFISSAMKISYLLLSHDGMF